MKGLPFVLIFLVLSTAWATPPPRGKSIRSDGVFQDVDIPTGSVLSSIYDLPNRIRQRSQKLSDIETKKSMDSQKSVKMSTNRYQKVGFKRAIAHKKPSNLPDYYQDIDHTGITAKDASVYVSERSKVRLHGLTTGDVITAVIEQEIKASPSVPTPIRAVSLSSKHRGAYFLGEATLDQELKRILITFTKLRLPDSEEVFAIKAAGLSPIGTVGIEGEYSSQAGKFFFAELASATAAGVVDSTIMRQQTTVGGYVQEPSLANSARQGLVTALSRSADRNAELVKQAPEFTLVKGYQEIKILIQEDPTSEL